MSGVLYDLAEKRIRLFWSYVRAGMTTTEAWDQAVLDSSQGVTRMKVQDVAPGVKVWDRFAGEWAEVVGVRKVRDVHYSTGSSERWEILLPDDTFLEMDRDTLVEVQCV